MSWTTEHSAEVSFKAKGVTLKGGFEIADKSIDIEMDVPLLLRPFRQKAIDVVEEQIKEWIGKAKSGVARAAACASGISSASRLSSAPRECTVMPATFFE